MASNKPTCLGIDEDRRMLRFLNATLSPHGYQVLEASTGAQGLEQVMKRRPDLVLLDLALPDMDGLEVIDQLRTWTATPIIVLSERNQEADKVAALEAGADDYVTKPFGVRELLARMQVALRHSTQGRSEPGARPFTVGSLQIDLMRRQIFVEGREVHVTLIEYKMLAALVQHAGQVLTYEQLTKIVWGPETTPGNHLLQVHVGQLRQKLEADPACPCYILTELGVGYRLAAG